MPSLTVVFRFGRATLDRVLTTLLRPLNSSTGDRTALATAVVAFMGDVGKGFSPSAFGNRFKHEVQNGCFKKTTGKPALIQELAKCLVDDPSHRGVSAMFATP